MEQANFHKLKLYALVVAGVAFVSLLLPWISVSFLGMSESRNGFRDVGILSVVGVAGVVILTLMGNKSEAYTEDFKKFTMLSFAAIALGAIIFLMRKNSAGGFGIVEVKTGIGLWLCLLAGLGGVALLYGLIKIEDKKSV
jgi:hypothetical protein